MLFEPSPINTFVRNHWSEGLRTAAVLTAAEWLVDNERPWTFYAGVFAGSTALATGLPGAQMTMYLVGSAIDLWIYKSPEGAQLEAFLDGVAVTSVSTYAADAVWEKLTIALDQSARKRLDLRNSGPGINSPYESAFLAVRGPFELLGANPDVLERSNNMALVNIISFSVRDDDGDVSSIPFYYDTGLSIAEYELAVGNLAPDLDAVTGSVIEGATLTLNMTLPGGLKTAPVASIENQRGANLSFNAANSRYKHSIRIPGVIDSLFSGKSFVTTAGTAGEDLIASILSGSGPAIPRDRQGNDLTALAGAVKAFRRK